MFPANNEIFENFLIFILKFIIFRKNEHFGTSARQIIIVDMSDLLYKPTIRQTNSPKQSDCNLLNKPIIGSQLQENRTRDFTLAGH